jgi:hypothetical protein
MTSTRPDAALAPVLRELSRIADCVESRRAAEDRATIEALRREVAELRAAVAQLRSSRGPVPISLQPVVARSMAAQAPARSSAPR